MALPATFFSLLQIVFLERVLYLDHTASVLDPKGRQGYFVGYSLNAGDDLTYRIFDDQT